MIIDLEFKSKLRAHISIILNQEKKKPVEDYDNENEVDFKDDSEKIELEEHYNGRNRKWKKEDDEI